MEEIIVWNICASVTSLNVHYKLVSLLLMIVVIVSADHFGFNFVPEDNASGDNHVYIENIPLISPFILLSLGGREGFVLVE